jgi:hypothetical protein
VHKLEKGTSRSEDKLAQDGPSSPVTLAAAVGYHISRTSDDRSKRSTVLGCVGGAEPGHVRIK